MTLESALIIAVGALAGAVVTLFGLGITHWRAENERCEMAERNHIDCLKQMAAMREQVGERRVANELTGHARRKGDVGFPRSF